MLCFIELGPKPLRGSTAKLVPAPLKEHNEAGSGMELETGVNHRRKSEGPWLRSTDRKSKQIRKS